MEIKNSAKSVLKSFPFLLLFLMISIGSAYSQVYRYSDSWGPEGLNVLRQSASGVTINFSIQNYSLDDVNVDGITMKSVHLPEVFLPNNEGYPDLPGLSRMIAIPQGSKASFRIVSQRTEILKDVMVAPAPRIPKDTEVGPLKYAKDFRIYSKNSYYPENPVLLSEISQLRGVDFVVLGVTPFQYNPQTKELIIYRDLKIEINFTGGNFHFGSDAFRNRWFDPILEDAFFNSASLPKIDYGKRNVIWDKTDAYGYEYVIICPNVPVFLQWADTIKNFRIAQGIKTKTFTLTQIGGNDPTLIKNFIVNAYNNWTIKPVAVLMLGDYNPPDANNALTSPIYDNYCVSDNILGDVNNNQLPEVIMARMTAQDATQLQTMVTKSLDYEKNPPTLPSYYNKPITALGWQTERWFQLCSEVVGGYWKKKMGKLPTRINAIYSGTPGTVWSSNQNTSMIVNYFGPAGTYYIPLTPDSLGGWSGGTAQMVVNALNEGAFALQHRDHGAETGWGEPAFQSSNIDQLTNAGLMSFIFSINCLTGKYNYSTECFAEKFHRYKYMGQNAGAMGLIAASETSYSFVNDAYVWGMMDNFWPDFMPTYGTTPSSRDFKPAFGNAAGKIFLYSSNWPYNPGDKEVTYHLFHHHGDAFLNIYSSVPTNMIVNHASTIPTGVNTFSVTADSGAFIALTIDTTILGTGTSTGSSINISIPGTQVPPQIMKVVATKQNKYRYTANVQVIPNAGPYVIFDSVAINDVSPLGNGNGKMDYGETNQLTIRVKNVGSVNANNVTVKITTSDPFVTMTDSTENFGTVNAGATKTISNAFAYTVNNLIPDNRTVAFNVAANDGSNYWTSQFAIISHAPVMKMGSIQIVDSLGNNNGRLDPGENVRMYVTFKNTGTSIASGVTGRLFENSTYVTVNGDSLNYGTINYGDSVKKYFNVNALITTPIGTLVKFTVNMKPALRNVEIDTFNVTVGQNVFTIGTGTISCNFPFTTYWMDGRTDMLFTASELAAAGCFTGNISKIGFYVITADPAPMNGFNVKMQTTTATSISGFTTTGWTTCYSGVYALPGTGWQLITLQTPFYWNGSSNVLIEVCYNNSSYTQYSPVYASSAPNMYYGRYGDLSTGDGCATTSWSSSTSPTGRPNISLTMNVATGIENNTGIPIKYNLSQNYPNPFNPITKIDYAIPKQGFVSIKIYDLLGREISTLVSDVKQAGYYSADFDGSNLSSGVYFYKMESTGFTDTKKFVLLK